MKRSKKAGNAVKTDEYDWPFEISGMGGGYEDACRRMTIAAAEWLKVHPDEPSKWDKAGQDYKASGHNFVPDSVYGKSYRKFDKAVTDVCPDCTAAMFNAAVWHGRAIFDMGWDAYVKYVIDKRSEKGKEAK